MFNLAKILLPNFIIKHCIADKNKKIRFYNIVNIYIWILIWHIVVLGVSYISLDKCTNVFHDHTTDNNNLYCTVFDFFIYVFVGIIGILILSNVVSSIIFYHFNKYKKNVKQVEDNEVEINDNVFVLATLYKESKEDIEQMINSLADDDYKNLCVMLVLDGEYCVDILFNEIFSIDPNILQYSVNLDGNDVKYVLHISKGTKYLIVVKSVNQGKKHSQCIFYDMININHNPQEYMTHPLIPFVKYLNQRLDINSYKYVLLLDGDTIIENNKTIEKMVHIMNTYPNFMAICGTTHVLNKNTNLITMSQTFEYFTSHLLLKLYETIIFNTLVMSGCFSMLRLRTDHGVLINEPILEEYNKIPTNLVEDNLIKFGEDRYLTSILINTYADYKIKYIPEINCYTDVPVTIKNLVLQRQRWTNSLLACHIYLLKSKFISLKLYFLIFIELAVILILPLLIVVGITNFIMAITIQGFSFLPVIITSNIVLLNLYIVILTGNI